MHLDFMNYAIAGFTFVLIILFALAVFQDYRWRKIEPPLHTVGSENKTHFPPKSADSDDKVTSSALYSLYTALSARGLGTAEQLITVRGEKSRISKWINPRKRPQYPQFSMNG